MEPPLVNEAPFSATDNPSSYSFSELLSFPMSGRGGSGLRTDGLAEESTVTQHSGSHGRNGGEKRKRDDGNSFYDDSSKLVSSCTANSDLNKSNMQTKAPRVRDENGELKIENSGTNVKQQEKSKHEPPKDYIHVRARRGQATDSHSLAERARREKISERMKILEDLVPGCNKVIGKALVLDEIINYIQSLQQQVEFLSMKLEAVNSRLNPTLEGYPSKDLVSPTFDVNGMLYGSQTPREYARGTQAEWLHMQVGSGFQRAN